MITSTDIERAEYKNVWVVAEISSGNIQPVTYELIGAARQLADARKCEVWTVVMGTGVSDSANIMFSYGSDTVVIIDDPALQNFIDEAQANVMSRLIDRYKPEIILCAATSKGRALIPRVAVMAECGLTADCTELSIDPENGDLLQTRPAFGGNIMATIRCSNHRPQMASVRPRVMKTPDRDPARSGKVIVEKLIDDDLKNIKKITEVFQSSEATVNLADAQIIISGGRGVRGKEGFDLLQQLADRMGGAVGASRAAIDSGWIPYTHQIGQTGQTVQTKVYIACGISGQIQHLVGMQSSDLIIAIDKNPDTPMMQIADIAIIGDLFEVIPELIRKIDEK